MKNTLLKWEIIGAHFIFFLGSILHFVFEWSGYWAPIGIIAPVNESVWEHLKLSYWPLIFSSLIEYRFIKDKAKNIIIAKTAAVFVIPILTVLFFYAYTTIFGVESLAVDIISFYIFIVIGQLISYKIMSSSPISKLFSWIALIAFISLGIIYIVFTYFPPLLPIFLDSGTGTYGIAIRFH
ncbi:MAG: DUF6512 family protein [Promethearchaeota archaeon]|jgi:hypothetical protein